MNNLFVLFVGLIAVAGPVPRNDGRAEYMVYLLKVEQGHSLDVVKNGQVAHIAIPGHEARILDRLGVAGSTLGSEVLLETEPGNTDLSNMIHLGELLGDPALGRIRSDCLTVPLASCPSGAGCCADELNARVRLVGGSLKAIEHSLDPRSADAEALLDLLPAPRDWVGFREVESGRTQGSASAQGSAALVFATQSDTGTLSFGGLSLQATNDPFCGVIAAVAFPGDLGRQSLPCAFAVITNLPQSLDSDPQQPPLGDTDYHFERFYELLDWEVAERYVPYLKARPRPGGAGNPPGSRCRNARLSAGG